MLEAVTRYFAAGPDAPRIQDENQVRDLYRRHRVRVMVAITLGYGLIYMCRLALGVVKQPLIDAGIFTPSDLGLIGSALFYTYAFGKLTNGFLADHANMKRFLAIGFLLTALCNIAMGFTTTVWLAALIWGLNGWFQSVGAPGGVVAMTAWYSNRERGRTYGIWSTAHSIGEGLTFLVIGAVVAAFGWRYGYWLPGAIGLITAAGCYWLLQDRPATLGLPPINEWKNDTFQEQAHPGVKTLLGMQLSILKRPAIWILCLASATNYVMRYAIDSWGILYLQEARGYSLTMAGTLLMISTLAGIVGAVAYGYMSDKWFDARRPPVNLIFAIVELIGVALLFFGPANLTMLVISMLLYGVGVTGLVTSLGGLFAVDIAPKRAAGAAMGVIGVFSYLGAGLEELISGRLIQHGMKVVNGERIYDFNAAIGFWIGAAVVSMLLALVLWRTRRED
jgi:OPA family sugar phosphate sensor protein UhpC-like MFS transporter